MIDVARLILENFTTLCLAIGLGIIISTNQNLDKKTNRSFVAFVAIVLVLVFADITDSYLAGLTEPSVLRYITSAIGYTLRPASMVIFISILTRRKRTNVAIWIPIVILAVIAFTSYFTHIMFWFSPNNYFMRGPFGYLSHIVSAAYLLTLVIMTIKMHRHLTSGEIFTVVYIAVICVIATVAESKLAGYKFLVSGAMITSCALYYVVLYIETYRRDPLTGLMNRKSFYIDANRMRNKSIAVISIDLNGLKEINDNFGHSAGDMALQNMGNAMFVNGGEGFLAYRVGGDEFMALGKGKTAEACQAYIDEMRTALAKDDIMASFGCAIYNSGDNFDDICNLADVLMYKDKKQYNHRRSNRT